MHRHKKKEGPISLLGEAIDRRDLDEVERLVRNYDSLLSYSVTSKSWYTPFLLAARRGSHEQLVFFLRQLKSLKSKDEKKQIEARDAKGRNAFIMAACGGNVDCLKKLLELKRLSFSIEDKDNKGRTALNWAASLGKKEAVQYLLMKGAVLTKKAYDECHKSIKMLFDYSPGREEQSIYRRCLGKQTSSEWLEAVFSDYEQTSDEESSDSEDEDFQRVNHDLHVTKKDKILARGTHYSPDYFDSAQKRRRFSRPKKHQQPIYSRATADLANKLPRKDDGSLDCEHADQLIKGYFEQLRLTPDRRELRTDITSAKTSSTRNKEFESLYYRFIQAYVNSYGDLFNHGGMRKNFNFYGTDNPMLSTTSDVKVALLYASGERINHSNLFSPKLRRSTGAFKYRRLGYVHIYIVNTDYFNKNVVDINQLNNSGLIGLSHNYSFNKEFLLPSSIPAEYVLGFQVFALPKMRCEWDERIKTQYGLTRKEYNNFQNQFKDSDEDTREEAIKKLIAKVTTHQAESLEQKIEKLKRKDIPRPPSRRSSAAESLPLSTNKSSLFAHKKGKSESERRTPRPSYS
ncbi:MAG: ankyrin repeat domain-containing protein [Gammaproteobacteria bacterium]|nr:ankyrin repeat domain-containing protein [Gammaproteobacteria bacterium]